MFKLVRNTAVVVVFLLGAAGANADDHDDLCPPMTGGNAMKLEVDEYQLTLTNKKPICVIVDDTGHGTVNLKIKNNKSDADHVVEKGDVTVEQKAGAPFKIWGSNTEKRLRLVINIAPLEENAGDDTDCGDETIGECAKFWIKVKDVGDLDPKMRVVEGTFQMGNYANILQEVLDDLNLTIEQATMILEDYGKEAK